ncbi:choice-of-anchor C family protein [Ottowia sp.]|uniref:choice-of-anchor C family protein n=1 Tax=Ottowia sp. TaxID=1898956 RepID=UPI003A8B5FE5
MHKTRHLFGRFWLRQVAFFVLSVAGASAAWAAPFQNGSFELGTDPGSFLQRVTGGSDITGWTVSSGNIDYIGTYWMPHSDGARSLDLSGGRAGRMGTIEQAFDTVAGHEYRVTFAMSGNSDCGNAVKTMRVAATGGVSVDYTFDTATPGHSRMNMIWETQTYAFTASGASTTLSFSSLENSNCGPALDHVQLVDRSAATTRVTAVPTLSEGTLILLGVAVGAAALRRRKATGR